MENGGGAGIGSWKGASIASGASSVDEKEREEKPRVPDEFVAHAKSDSLADILPLDSTDVHYTVFEISDTLS